MSATKNNDLRSTDFILKRVYLLFGMMLLVAVAIFIRIIIIQFVERDKWEKLGNKDRVYIREVVAGRGNILTEDGAILATSLPYFRVAMDPQVLGSELDKIFEGHLDDSLNILCSNLATQFGSGEFDANYFKSRIISARDSGDRHVYLVKKPVNYQQLKMLRTWPILNRGKYKGGLIVEKIDNKRFYPFGNLGRITLGILKDDTLALKGIEYSFNHDLKGTNSKMLVQRIAGGGEMPIRMISDKDVEDGNDVVTTLNIEMQDIVESALEKSVKFHHAKYGVAILMEVETGKIRAIANYPETYNYAVSTLIEPGSTFKVASVIAALEDNLVGLDDTIDTGTGAIQYYDKILRDHIPHGKITFRHGFEVSSNVAISKIIYNAYKDKPEKFIAHLEKMGILNKVNQQLVGEPQPTVKCPGTSEWDGTTLPWLSIGYNVRLTPLQILTFYNAIANGGKMIEPMFVSEVRHNSKVLKTFESAVLNPKICSDKTRETLIRMMEGVVQNGTASNIRTKEYRIAGKTGTAQKLKNKKYQKVYQATFCGFFPSDQPKYTCFILIDEPGTGLIYGASVAGPVFREIADQVHSLDLQLSGKYLSPQYVPTTKNPTTRIVSLDNAEVIYNTLNISTPDVGDGQIVRTYRDGATIRYKKVKLYPKYIPEVVGMTSKDAVALLENLGMKVRLEGFGKVKKQSLPTGSKVERGNWIVLTLGT